ALELRKVARPRASRELHHDAAHAHLRDRSPFPGDGRTRGGGDVLVDPRRDPDRLLRGEALWERVRPPIACRLPDRDLDPDLLPRPDSEMDLRGEARLAAEHRP